MNCPAFTMTHPVPPRTAASDGPGGARPSSSLPHPAPPAQAPHRITEPSSVHCSGRFRLQDLDNTPVRAPRSRTYQHDTIQENR